MQCPICTDTALVMSERQGVELDYGASPSRQRRSPIAASVRGLRLRARPAPA